MGSTERGHDGSSTCGLHVGAHPPTPRSHHTRTRDPPLALARARSPAGVWAGLKRCPMNNSLVCGHCAGSHLPKASYAQLVAFHSNCAGKLDAKLRILQHVLDTKAAALTTGDITLDKGGV